MSAVVLLILGAVVFAFVSGYLIGWTRGKKQYPELPRPGQP